MKSEFDCGIVDNILNEVGRKKSDILAILKKIQERYNYLPADILTYVAQHSECTESELYEVARFYRNFSLTPRGKYVIKVCQGITCCANESALIVDTLKEHLGLSGDNNTTKDMLFTIETVLCLGACGVAPAISVNDSIYPSMTPEKVIRLIDELKRNSD